MKRVLLVVAAAVGLAACSDMFSPPELPDLFKDPYDFSVVVPPFKGDGGMQDMTGTTPHDLSMSSD